MIAYISGEAARGAILREGRYSGFILDEDGELTLRAEQLPRFFLNAWDVELIECSSNADLIDKIECSWRHDRALRLVLIVLDSRKRKQTRIESARCVEDFIQESSCLNFVLNNIYSSVLPSSCDVKEVSALLAEAGVSVLEDAFDTLVFRQQEVIGCINAWDSLPVEVFSSSDERAELRARIVKTGAFYRFASSDSGSNESLFRILADPILGKQASKSRDIVSLWASKYKELPSRKKFDYVDDKEIWSFQGPQNSGVAAGFEVYQKVKKQKSVIKTEYLTGSVEKADAHVEMLVRSQRNESSVEHLAKSLCDIAVFCRNIGDIDRFFEFSRRATEEAPNDMWALVQLGSAYAAKGEFSKSVEYFERAESLGDNRAALVGKAEAFKLMGQRDVALEILDRCIEFNPWDPVAIGSRASMLAHFGGFEDALLAYDKLIDSPLANAYAYGGRASVLHDLGRSEEALKDQDISIYMSGDDPIPFCAKADMLRELRRFDEALAVIDVSLKQPHALLQLESARSRILRDMGRFDECELVLGRIGSRFPKDVGSKVALAELYRKMGKSREALDLFLDVEKEFPKSKIGRNGMAAAYAALGKYEEAYAYLPARGSSTRSEWVAQHIRAMIDMKLNKWTEAEIVLKDGLENCPWRQQLPYFATALASLKIRFGHVSEARKALEDVARMEDFPSPVVELVSAHLELISNPGKMIIGEDLRLSGSYPVRMFVQKLDGFAASDSRQAIANAGLFELEWDALLALAA